MENENILEQELSDQQPSESDAPDSQAELERLREEVRTLNERLVQQQEKAEQIQKQIGDFCEAFPTVELNTVPEIVWESVRSGNSLAAAYALYAHRIQQKEARINEQNQKNAYRSAGFIGKSAANEYFTPDEVKKMSQSEVKSNYSKILESMKKWYN